MQRLDSNGASIAPDTASVGLAPLVVDLDGTLTPTDTLMESIILLLRRNPLDALRIPFWMWKGRAAFKAIIASKSAFSAQRVPYRTALVRYLFEEKEKGRRIILATAAHQTVADAIAMHIRVFDEVLASDSTRNLKGSTKLDVIRRSIGERFVYAGDSASDLTIWRAAEAAILVGASSRVSQAVRRYVLVEREFAGENGGLTTWLRALRVHQWIKNLLVFVPLLTAFSFLEGSKVAAAVIAFFSFCLAASASYLVNDLWDLESDRAHPRKNQRAFASAQIPIARGMGVALTALILALLLASTVSRGFAVMLVLYLVITSIYSWRLKAYVLIDVLTLSLLYTLRILAGSVAVGVTTSSWLLAFSMFMFFSLALVKRCSELLSFMQIGQDFAVGRDYRVSDLAVLWPLGVGSALCAVVVFGLFINAAETRARYTSPDLLWLVAIGLIYWLSRLWIKSARGEMHDDPLVFALGDFGSRVTVLCMVAATVAAYFGIRVG